MAKIRRKPINPGPTFAKSPENPVFIIATGSN
jgi:hypothetical protein